MGRKKRRALGKRKSITVEKPVEEGDSSKPEKPISFPGYGLPCAIGLL